MEQSGKTDMALKKSYEISYALWRVATNVSEKSFGSKLFQKSIELLGLAVDGDYTGVENMVSGLEMLIRFGVDINTIGLHNAESLLQEIANLRAAIMELRFEKMFAVSGKRVGPKDVDLSDIFTEPSFEETKVEVDESTYAPVESAIPDSGNDSGNRKNGNAESDYIPEIRQPVLNRQTAILEKIREIGNCRLSDIQAILPESSERTIRYDLESLVRENVIERVGVGGRGVYYRIKTK
jgi:hypothetical protein